MLNVYRRRIGRTLRRRGLLGTARMALGIGLSYLKDALSPARRAVRRCRVAREGEFKAREAEFDQAYGVDTAGIVSLDTIDEVVGPNNERLRDQAAAGVIDRLCVNFTYTYEGVDFVVLRERIAALGIDFPQYTFIDLGCGKGRALLIAAQFPFRQVRGVEFAPALHAVAEKNIAVYRGPRRCCDVRADLADAAEYPVPDGLLVVFLYNPFGRAVMDRVLANLTRSHREQPRDIWVIYWNPREEALFDRHGFARVADIPEGPAINWQGDRSIVWRLFSSPAAAATPAATADRNSEARKNLDLQNAETSGAVPRRGHE